MCPITRSKMIGVLGEGSLLNHPLGPGDEIYPSSIQPKANRNPLGKRCCDQAGWGVKKGKSMNGLFQVKMEGINF